MTVIATHVSMITRFLSRFCVLVVFSMISGVAFADSATYTLIHSKVSGAIGGTFFTDAELQFQYTLSDTSLLVNSSGGAPSNGSFVQTPDFPGTELAFTITGGGLPSQIVGTYTSADQFRVGASTAASTGALFFMTPGFLPILGMQVPGIPESPTIPTLDRLRNSVTFTRNVSGNPAADANSQDPPGTYVGGVAVDNISSFPTTAGTLILPQDQSKYNGTWTTVAVPEPATTWMAVAAGLVGLGGSWRRRQRRGGQKPAADAA